MQFEKTKGLHVKKARKRQICDYCGEHIIKGEKYKFWRYDDEQLISHRLHDECFSQVLYLQNDECIEVEFDRKAKRPDVKNIKRVK